MALTSTSATIDAVELNNVLHKDPSLSPSFRFKGSPEPLLLYIVSNVDSMIECSSIRQYYQHHLLPPLPVFIHHLYRYCHLTPSVLVVALIYLKRLKTKLPCQSQGEYDTPYKLFLAAVLLALKYIEDSKKHISLLYHVVSPLYTRNDLNEMERSFLGKSH
ncbi:cyclin domain-containing protein [Radiomyces spectabilis]|uniref:cyclin domain-containing protein n=1 Tax=Radiomyces spectabilis TaxID=64574 RepID=UPI002220DBB0|nr:cyclin domain-containing protein [Radiomyces spectabilis]KAI8380997.1 cyclin domain-containing protein [Radiomyces spectabilis]